MTRTERGTTPTRRKVLAVAAVLAVVAPVTAALAQAQPVHATYASYDVGISGGEPGLGYDPKADAVVYGSGTSTKRITFAEGSSTPTVTVADITPDTSATTLDAITWTDQRTSRTFVSQLLLACSATSFSDDAGRSYTPSQGCGAGTVVDHQTLGGGPYRAPAPVRASTAYPNAVYYCAQDGFRGSCARSDDGGLTFGAAVPAYNTPANTGPAGTVGGNCSAIHGHLRVGPDGTVYLPNKGCGGTPTPNNLTNSEFFGGAPAVSVSEDNGLTWTVRPVPGAANQDESDPSVDTDRDGTVYFGWEDGTNPSETVYGTTSAAKIAVSPDHGRTWSRPYDVSSALGLANVQFPEVIAGDAGRAAFSFIGTPTAGDDQHDGFVGEWHLYVATTTDGGASWDTVDATPTDPVQRGCISLQGTSNKTVADTEICSQRNLLDFNDITLDKTGRVLVAYADGCPGACTVATSTGARNKLLRQESGPLLYVTAPDASVSSSATASSSPTTGQTTAPATTAPATTAPATTAPATTAPATTAPATTAPATTAPATTAPATTAPATTAPATTAPATTAPATTAPATTAPATTAPPTTAPATCPAVAPVVLARQEILSGASAGVRVSGTPGSVVDLVAYTRPSTRYRTVRSARIGATGVADLSLTPPSSTRMYQQQRGCDVGPSSVLRVRTTLSLDVRRTGAARTYRFFGNSLPRRAGGLSVSLYRVTPSGAEVLTSRTRTDPRTGLWSITRTFTGTGRTRFVLRTAKDTANEAGASAVRTVALR